MSNAPDPQNDDGEDLVPRRHIRDLETKAQRAEELQAEVERLQREAVFSSALAGLDHKGLQYFKDGYKGELDAEAIRQAAVDAGFGPTGQPAPEPTPQQSAPANPADLAAHQRMAAAQAGAAPPPPFDLNEAISTAKTPEEVMALVEQHGEKHGLISSRLTQ